MCLLVFAWLSHPRYRLVLAGNRDEFHDRPAAPLGWWTDVPGILAGRDLRAGGTWMGLSRSGRFGVVTNFRNVEAAAPEGSPSRGQLVPRYLGDDRATGPFVEELKTQQYLRAPVGVRYCLLVHGDQDALVPVDHAHRVYACALNPRRLEIIPGADHRLTDPAHRRRAVQASLEWIGRFV